MAYRDLSTETMVKCAAAWVDPKGDRKILSALPTMAALLGVIDDTYKHLLDKQSSNGVVAKKIKEISDEQALLDTTVHDPKLRASYNLLTGLSDGVDDPKLAKACVDLRDALCPDGLAGTKKSYTDEAGAAEMLLARLTPEQKKLLERIKLLGGGTLADVVKARCDAARKLGVLDAKKLALQKRYAVDDMETDVKQAEVLTARYKWMNVVRAMEANLKVANVDQATVDRILGPVRDAEAKAAQGGSAPEEATPPETTPPEAAPPTASPPTPTPTPTPIATAG